MKNKQLKISLITISILTLIFLLIVIIINTHMLKEYEYQNNLIISNIINQVQTKYPSVSEEEIISLLNTKDSLSSDILSKYGIYLKDSSLSIYNQTIIKKLIIINSIIIIIYLIILLCIIVYLNKQEQKKIKLITNYLYEINNQNYQLDILSNTEDDLSLLKNELYKTAVILNEQNINLKQEKLVLKDSLSNISHQLKTPLTSISLMIDNLEEHKNLTKEEHTIINNIHRKISHINFLIQSLLKLSKFDADAIEFIEEDNYLKDILNEVLDNLSPIADLKNIKISIKGPKDAKLKCDYKWQVEALTNIVKNCLEHSKEDTEIKIEYSQNNLLTKILITDQGEGIPSKDLKNIFKRFYKGKNSHPDSIGIGLPLSKAIIEQEHGTITVSSTPKKGTTFTIKYLT